MRESRFVRLTEYCLVEYMLEPLGSLDYITNDFILVENDYSNSHQIFNKDGAFNVTRNIQDVSAVPIDGSRYVYLDSEKVPDYIDYDDKLTATDITGFNVLLDKVRFHFISGFDFNDFRALVLSIKNKENDGTLNLFCNILLSAETIDTLITYNPKPLYITNRMYDRYVDVFIPSIKNVNEEFNISPTPAATFSAAITPTNGSYDGFITNNPITIAIDECATQDTIQTDLGFAYDSFKISEHYETSVSQSNEYDTVGVYIGQSTAGDFIEFFLTFSSGFPEELIAILNKRNPSNDWIIAHELTIYEQIGSTFVEASRLAFFQDSNFDEPNLFRPVLKHANEAVSMSIDYIARLVNRLNGDQIIREASYNENSPKKYGLNLLKIELDDKPQSQKIYNKIYKKNFEATQLFIEPSLNSSEETTVVSTSIDSNVKPLLSSADSTVCPLPTTITSVVTKKEYIPIFFDKNNISISIKNAMVTNSNNVDEIIYGQGKLKFVITPFDNYLKFKFYTSENKYGIPVPLDLNITASKFRAVFETASGKIKIDNVGDSSKENPAAGEIVFNIANEDSEEILQSPNRAFYLTSVSQEGTETLMYTGEWRTALEQIDVDEAAAEATEALKETTQVETKITAIENKVKKLQNKQIQDRISNTVKKFKIDIPGFVKKKGTRKLSTVNRFRIKNATKIKSNRSLSDG